MAKGKPCTGNWGLARGGQASARIEIARVCHTSHRTGRPDQAQDGAGQLVGALLDGEVFDDPLLDLVKTIMIIVENLLGEFEVLLDLGPLRPRDRQEPVEV